MSHDSRPFLHIQSLYLIAGVVIVVNAIGSTDDANIDERSPCAGTTIQKNVEQQEYNLVWTTYFSFT